MLREDVEQYTKLTGEDGWHVPIIKVGAYLDGYNKGLEVLDKIKTEIADEKEYAYADFEQYKIDYLDVDAEYVEDELPYDDFRYGMERAIDIIDKYKAKSEE